MSTKGASKGRYGSCGSENCQKTQSKGKVNVDLRSSTHDLCFMLSTVI